MKPIQESITTKAPAKIVWKAWVDMYQAKTGGKPIFKEGYKGFIVEGGRKVSFVLKDIIKGQSFTTVWKSPFVRTKFSYEVKQISKGSLITTTVRFGGLFGWISRLFLKSKIKKNLSKSLEQFASQLDMSQQATKMRKF